MRGSIQLIKYTQVYTLSYKYVRGREYISTTSSHSCPVVPIVLQDSIILLCHLVKLKFCIVAMET